jgi:DHA1 family tetracycline resistance protein-like MFS transporter
MVRYSPLRKGRRAIMSVDDPTPDAAPALAAEAPPAASNRSALLIVFLVVFIDLLGFGIVLPLLPRFADEYVNQLPALRPNAGLIIGLLMASFSLMQFLFSPMWGRLSDRVGRRPILLFGLLGSVLFYSLFGYALSLDAATYAGLALALFFAARIGAGIFGATIATAQAAIADCTPPEKRKHGMALIGAAFGIGFTFGPLFGYASLGTDRHEFIGYAAAALSLVALILGLILLPETRRFSDAPPMQRKWLDFVALRFVLTSTAIWPVILTFFLATLGFAAFETTLAILVRDALGYQLQETLLVFAYVGFVLMLTQGFFYRRVAHRYSEATWIVVGILFMGGGVAALGLMTWMARPGAAESMPLTSLLFAGATLAVIGFAFLTPSTNALISRRTDSERQGEILGVNQSAASLARILGPVAGLTLYFLTESHLLPYLFGSALLLGMLPMMPKIRRG